MKGLLSRSGNMVARVEWAVIGLLLMALTIVVTLQVVARNLDIYIEWVEDVAVLFLVWKVLIASSLAIRHGGHYVVNLFGEVWQPLNIALTVLSVFVTAVMLFIFFWKGSELAWQLRFRLSGAGEISMFIYYAALPISSILSLFHLVETLVLGAIPLNQKQQGA